MRPIDQLIRPFLRGRLLVGLIVYALPFIALIGLGFLWLAQQGLALHFVLSVGVLVLLYRLGLAFALRAKSAPELAEAPAQPKEEGAVVAPNPDWTPAQAAVFETLRAEIAQTLAQPLPWPDLQQQGIAVARSASALMSDGKKDVLAFSMTEALLLISRVSSRLRDDLRLYVPLADTVSLSSLMWLWKHREWLGHANTARRLGSAVLNPPKAIAQEAINMMMGQAVGQVKATAERTFQRLILEEVAKASVDLFGGHLRFSDAELLQVSLASQGMDMANAAPSDTPLRVVVVGQVSAGKTSLINALAGEALGETDMAPTTPQLVSHSLELSLGQFSFADTEGLNGSVAVTERVLAQMLEADLVLWAVRANRPARAPDAQLLEAFRSAIAAQPLRRAPRIVMAVTFMDRLLPQWPWPENWIPEDQQAKVTEVLENIAAELGQHLMLPVVAEAPDWNIAQLETLIAAEAPEALMVQRNRRRLTAQKGGASFVGEVGKGGRGVLTAGKIFFKNWRR